MTVEPRARLVYLDALRGLAILLMVQDHAFDWWLRGEFHATPWGRVTEFLGALAAPLFLFLMGASLALWTQKRVGGGMPLRRLGISQLRRGLFLILQGYVVTWLVFYNGQNAAELWAVDVLHCLGLSMIVLIPLTLAQSWPLALLGAVVAAMVSPWAGDWHLPPWLAVWINGSAGVSYFPLFPFVVYALAGLAAGQLLARALPSRQRVSHLMLALVPTGAGLLLMLPLIPPDLGHRFPRPIFQIFSLALILWLTALAYALAFRPGMLRPLTKMGQTAMMIYIVHHLLGFRLFYHLGWATGHSWQGQYGVFSPAEACLLLALLLAVLLGLAEAWLIWRPRIGPAALVRRWAPALAPYW